MYSFHLTDLGPVYTWRTLTGVKLNNNFTQYSSPEMFWQCNQGTEPELHKRKIFRLRLFCEKLRFNHFAQRTIVKSNISQYLKK